MIQIVFVVITFGFFIAMAAPTIVAIYRWWFGARKLLSERLPKEIRKR